MLSEVQLKAIVPFHLEFQNEKGWLMNSGVYLEVTDEFSWKMTNAEISRTEDGPILPHLIQWISIRRHVDWTWDISSPVPTCYCILFSSGTARCYSEEIKSIVTLPTLQLGHQDAHTNTDTWQNNNIFSLYFDHLPLLIPFRLSPDIAFHSGNCRVLFI